MFGPTLDFWIIFYLGGALPVFPLGVMSLTSDDQPRWGKFFSVPFYWPIFLLFFVYSLLADSDDQAPYFATCGLITFLLSVLGGCLCCGYFFPDTFHAFTLKIIIVSFVIIFVSGVALIISESFKTSFTIMMAVMVLFAGLYTYNELDLTLEEQLVRERALLAKEKREVEEKHERAAVKAQERVEREREKIEREAGEAEAHRRQEIKDARLRVELAKIHIQRAQLSNLPIPKEIAEQISQAQRQLEQLRKPK